MHPQGHPKITYLDQAIPSLMGMPHYHKEELVDAKSFTLDHALGYIHDIDFSGKAVEEYARRVQLAASIYSQHRLLGEHTVSETFPFQSEVATSAMRQLKMYAGFKRCKECKKYGSQSFYSQAFTFQQRETFTWRGEVKKATSD